MSPWRFPCSTARGAEDLGGARDEIGSCSKEAYAQLSMGDAQKLLKLDTLQQTADFCQQASARALAPSLCAPLGHLPTFLPS